MNVQPAAIRLEAASYCQLRCPSCPTTTQAIRPAVAGALLPFREFRRLLDDNPFLRSVELSNYGEAFLNPALLQMLEYAFRKGVRLTLQNGANLNDVSPEVLEGLVRYRFQALRCSIDGASPETYRQYRRRGSFEQVIENIRTINRHKAELGSPEPQLIWQFIVFGHNEHEIGTARQKAAELGMDFQLKLNWDETFSPIRDRERVRREARLAAVTREEHRQRTGQMYAQSICRQLWTQPQINADGTMLGCCRNYWGDFGGNAFRDGLLGAVNHEKMRYARAMLTGHAPARADIPCTTCDLYLHRRASGQWLRVGPAPGSAPAV